MIAHLLIVAFLFDLHATANCQVDVHESTEACFSDEISLLQTRSTLTRRVASLECVDQTLPVEWSRNDAHDCSPYSGDEANCLRPILKEKCCFCGGGITQTFSGCVDGALNSEWSGGGTYTCNSYNRAYCVHDEEFRQKCCYCGGGAVSEMPVPNASLPAPTRLPTPHPTSPPTENTTPNSPPISTPSSGGPGCGTCMIAGHNCFIVSWMEPCVTAASTSSCESFGGVHCR
mmetsp:Transcript_7687/g.20966  ORF Transcript_7687/g.20966 Transcript_7687/m.20966 type:complete len:231 (-) Transcript_7687:95-787(-)